MDNNVTSLLHIPWTDVIYKNILPHLSLRDLFNLRSMSKSHKNLIDSYLIICPKVNLALNRRINKYGFKVLFKNCRRIKHLNLERCNWITDDILAQFLARNKYIVDINLSYCSNINTKAMHSLIVNCSELTSLQLAGCEWLATGTLDALTYHQKNLQTVDFTKCTLLSERCLIKFVIKFTVLKTLSLAFIPSVSDITMMTIAHHCAELENLNVDGCMVTIQAINTVILSCPKLESIKLSGLMMLRENFTKPYKL